MSFALSLKPLRKRKLCKFDNYIPTLTILAGSQRNHEESLQVSRGVRELQHPDLLDAAGRLQGGWELSEGEARAGKETGDGQEACEGREQRGH